MGQLLYVFDNLARHLGKAFEKYKHAVDFFYK